MDLRQIEALCKRISKRRRCGKRICGVKSASVPDIGTAAHLFGLKAEDDIYDQVDEEFALVVLTTVLHRDMAYQAELMPKDEAAEFARRFISAFPRDDRRIYTNGDLGHDPDGWVFNCATDATIDSGILVTTPSVVGCLWFMDED